MVKTKCLFISACRQLCQESVHVKPGGGVLDISLGGEVRSGPSCPDPV